MDQEILVSKLAISTRNLLSKRLSTIQAPTEYLAFVKASQNLVSEYIVDRSVFPQEEGIRLFRLAVRASHAIGDIQWLREINVSDPTNDPVVYAYTGTLTGEEPGSIRKKLDNLLKQVDPLKDPKGWTVQLSIILNLIEILGRQGRLDLIREYLDQAREITSKEESSLLHSYLFARILGITAWWEREKGDIDLAKQLNSETLAISNSINSESLTGFIHTLIGALHSQEGNIKQAIENYKTARDIQESIGDELRAIGNEMSMAWDIMAMGDPNQAIQVLKKVHTKYSQLLRPEQIPIDLIMFMADVYRRGGHLDDALKYARKAYETSTKGKEQTYIAGGARSILASILIDRDELDEGQRILEELAQTIKEVPMDYIIISYYYELGRLEIRRKNIGQAHKALQEALRWASKPGNFDPLLKIQLTYTHLYIQEYRITEKIEFLNKAKTYIENAIQASKEQNFIYLLYQALILRSNIEGLQEEYDKALKTLKEALTYTEDYPNGRKAILENISLVKSKMEAPTSSHEKKQSFMIQIWNQLRESFKFRFVKHPSRLSYTINGIIVLNDTGLPIYSKYLNEQLAENTFLISGLISAINTFSNELFGKTETGALKSIQHENMNILLESKETILIALLCDKDVFEIRNKLVQFIQELPPLESQIIVQENESLINQFDRLFEKYFLENKEQC